MQRGYLYIETHEQRPGLVRLLHQGGPLDPPAAGSSEAERIRYIARFNDVSTAHMHAHELLRRHLVNVDTGLYRVDIARAVASAESVGLGHTRLYLDPGLEAETQREIERLTAAYSERRRRTARFWALIGYLAAGLLAIRAVLSLLG